MRPTRETFPRARRTRPLSWLLALSSILVTWNPSCGQDATIPDVATPSNAGTPTTTHRQQVGSITFTLPHDLTIEQVASTDLIRWPIVADWDLAGRLVVAQSGGVSWPIQEHNALGLHKIIRLIDDDGDGRFDRRIVAAEELALPEGVLCLGNDILVAAPPVIWRLIDEDGDGICERRSVWFDGRTVTNCANDLHGPYWGRDGWIYWCKGAFADQTHTLADGSTLHTKAAHIFRRHPEGGPLESWISGGMDNPVEFASTPDGDRFFTSTFLQHPADGKRDGIGHAVYGSVFGKDHGVLDGVPRTGPLMTAMTHLGPAAPSGLIYLETNHWQPYVDGSSTTHVLASALFNLQKVMLHRLVPEGASFQTKDADLVVADRIDFHPTDVLEDSDGSLLVFDTGGWYDLCCPTSRVDQTTAPGGIYRLRPQNSHTRNSHGTAARAADWSRFSAETFRDFAFDARPWIRREAERRLPSIADQVRPTLIALATSQDAPLAHRQRAVWLLCQIPIASTHQTLTQILAGARPQLQQTILQTLAFHRYAPAQTQAEDLLSAGSPRVRRVAAQLLGRAGDRQAWDALLSAHEQLDTAHADRYLQHALLYAMFELSRRHDGHVPIDQTHGDRALAALLLVLDQLQPDAPIPASLLHRAINSDSPELQRIAALWLARQPELATATLPILKTQWEQWDNLSTSTRTALADLWIAWRDQPPFTALWESWLRAAPQSTMTQQTFLATHLPALRSAPWSLPQLEAVQQWYAATSGPTRDVLRESLVSLAIEPAARPAFASWVREQAATQSSQLQRLQTLRMLPAGLPPQSAPLESFVLESLLADTPDTQQAAADVLARFQPSTTMSQNLLSRLAEIPPRYLSTALTAIHRGGDTELQTAMLNELPQIAAARALPEAFLTNLFRSTDSTTKQLAQTTQQSLLQAPANIQAQVQSLLSTLPAGDAVRGLQVFRGSKAACSSCHRMGYVGTNLGPELTRIGQSRTREALLEAIAFPNARLEQSYRSLRVLTVDGQTYNGLPRARNASQIELQLNADQRVTIATDRIELLQDSGVSIMPSGLAEILTPQELADLLMLLQQAK